MLNNKTDRLDITEILLKVALNTIAPNRIGGIMVSVLSFNAEDCGFEPLSV
jgi:hypothetical protein